MLVLVVVIAMAPGKEARGRGWDDYLETVARGIILRQRLMEGFEEVSSRRLDATRRQGFKAKPN